MAQDPYGYPESTPPETAGAPSLALWTSISGLVLGAIAPCFCSSTWCFALPLGCAGFWYGLKALERKDPLERTIGTASIVSSTFTVVFSLMWIAVFAFYIAYFVFVIGLVGVGAMAGAASADDTGTPSAPVEDWD